jgi:hypothetical protein
MNLFDELSESYGNLNLSTGGCANTNSIFNSEINFTDVDFIQRKQILKAVRWKNETGKNYGLESNLLFDDLHLSQKRIKGIEKMIGQASKKQILDESIKSEIKETFKTYETWNKKHCRKSKHELRKKIRNKIFSFEIALNLALSNPNSELYKSYLNTIYYCQSMYNQDGYKLTSKYCNNRHCYSCNRIRTGKLMNNYMPFIEWMKEDMHLVTLTIKNVPDYKLKPLIKDMTKTFILIKDNLRKQKIKLTGLRKFECTHNQVQDEFHPHFHILIKGKDHAERLRQEWINYYNDAKIVDPNYQDIVRADLGTAKELFKYFTKFWSKKNKGSDKIIDYKSQNIIYTAIKGTRIFQPFGMNQFKKEIKIEIDESEEIEANIASMYNIEPDESEYYFNPETDNYMSQDGTELIDFHMNKKDKILFNLLNGSVEYGKKEKKKEIADPLKIFNDIDKGSFEDLNKLLNSS